MQTACATCLIQDRSLRPLKSVKLKHISLESLNIDVSSESEICWECAAEVTRWARFREKAATAQATLKLIQHASCHNDMGFIRKQFADRVKSLSTLSTEPQTEYMHFVHLDEYDIKSEATDMVDIELIPINDAELIPINDAEITEVTEIQKEFIVSKDTNVIDETSIALNDFKATNVIDEQNPLDEIRSETEDTDTFLHEEEIYIRNTLNSFKNNHNSDPLNKLFSSIEVPLVKPTSQKIVGQVRKIPKYLESVLNKNKRLKSAGILPQVIPETEILVEKKNKRSEVSESYNNSKRLKSTSTLVSNINLTARHSNVQAVTVTSEPIKSKNVSEIVLIESESEDNIPLSQSLNKKSLISQKGKQVLLKKDLILQTGKLIQSKVLATVKSNEFSVRSDKSNTNQNSRTATIKTNKVNKYHDTEIESAIVKSNKNLDTKIESTVKSNKNQNSKTKPSTVSDNKSNENQGLETESTTVKCIKNRPSETESSTVTNIEDLITTFTSVKSNKDQISDSESTFSDSDTVFDVSKPRSKASNHSQEIYQCKYEDCRMIFPTHPALIYHYKILHDEKPERKPHKKRPNKRDMDPSKIPKCPICDKALHPQNMKGHIEKIHNRPKRKERDTPCPHCGVKVTHLPSHIANVHERDENKYCAQCDVYYPSVGLKNSHLKKHSERTPEALKRTIPCPHCDKKWIHQRDVDRHVISIHTKEYPIICNLCGKGFSLKSIMSRHVRLKHEGYKKPKDKICPYCSKAFADKQVFRAHIRTHTGERPFHCAHCPWKFAQKNTLTTHMRGKHPELCGYVKK